MICVNDTAVGRGFPGHYFGVFEHKLEVKQLKQNKRLLALLKKQFADSKQESHINMLKSLERAVKLQKLKVGNKRVNICRRLSIPSGFF